MNVLFYNISVILLIVGIILMTYYITRATTDSYLSPLKKLENENLKKKEVETSIYDYRVLNTFKNIFTEPEIWLGYKSFDPSLHSNSYKML